MDRIAAPGNVGNLFVEGNPFEGNPATIVSARFLNGVQEELVGMIEAAGLTPNGAAKNQVRAAIATLFGNSPGVLQALGAAPFQTIGPVADVGQVVVLVAQSGLWIAGNTAAAPIQGTGSGGDGPGATDNTTEANEYDTGLYPGDAWAFVSLGAQMASSVAGEYPAALTGTNVNWYRHGFFLPRGVFVNGAVLEVQISGIFHSNESRIVEVVVEPEFDPDAAFDTVKAFAFQTGSLASTATLEHAVDIRVRLSVLGFDTGTNEWIVAGFFSFYGGNSAATAPNEHRRIVIKRIPIAKADFGLADTLWNVRVKTDDPGATLGDMGNASGSAQDGVAGVLEARHYSATLIPGGH